MLAPFVIELLLICSALIVTGWTLDTVSHAAFWGTESADPAPCAEDPWLNPRFYS